MNSEYEVNANQFICNILKKVNATIYSIIFLSIRIRKSWNIGNRNFLLRPKSKSGLYHVTNNSKNFSRKTYTNRGRNAALPDIETTDPKEKFLA